jgi:hypothetical protein
MVKHRSGTCGQRIKRSGVVCGLHRAQGDEDREFLGLASKPRLTVSPSLASKPLTTVSLGLASRPVATVSPGLDSKLVATVLMVWPQNHLLGFPDSDLKTDNYGLVIQPKKLPQWFLSLGLKTKWAMICQLCHKTDRRMKTV